MGCDIHSFVERRGDTGVWHRFKWLYPYESYGYTFNPTGPFDWRSYRMYGFLADVRNYSAVPPIAPPRGLPDDTSEQVRDILECNALFGLHHLSWLLASELLDFNYDALVEDRRVTIDNNGGATCAPGSGKVMPWREFLDGAFFRDLERLRQVGDPACVRVVFGFDN